MAACGKKPTRLREKAIRRFDEEHRKEQERVARFGQVRPQISTAAWQMDRIVAVRNRIYRSAKWKFFPDFLRDYVPEVLGMDWWKAEGTKPEAVAIRSSLGERRRQHT
jgi:hypothetical protein